MKVLAALLEERKKKRGRKKRKSAVQDTLLSRSLHSQSILSFVFVRRAVIFPGAPINRPSTYVVIILAAGKASVILLSSDLTLLFPIK